jgi:hypothetical protein
VKPTILLSAFLLAIVAAPASATSSHATVTPANIKDQTYPPLALAVTDVAGLKHFEVVVKGKAGDEARFLQDAVLTIVKAGRKVAACPVERVERKGDVVFSFEIASDHLAGSTFKLAYIAHVKMKDKDGKERWQGMPSGHFMTFLLAEFAKASKGK